MMAAAQRDFDPRTAFAGRRARSMRAATFSKASNTPPAMISRRVCGLSLFHRFFATLAGCSAALPIASLIPQILRRHGDPQVPLDA